MSEAVCPAEDLPAPSASPGALPPSQDPVTATETAPAQPAKDYAALIARTIEGVTKGLQQRETAFIAQIIELVREMSLKIESLSVHQLGEIIGKDLTTMAKLMKVACTVGYNPEGVNITTINEAIQVIGYNRIRNLAVSLLMLQNANRRWSHDEFDDVSSVMLTSSLMAEVISGGRRRIDPDHVFLCTALRSYGSLLLASFFSDDYRDAVKLIPERGEESAFREFFGLSALELSQDLLRKAHLPTPLLHALGKLNPALFEAETHSREEEQMMIVDFSIKFCELLARLKSSQEFDESYTNLLKQYGRVLCCTKDDMKRLLEETNAKIEMYRRSMQSPIFSNRVVQNIQAILEDQPLIPKPEAKRKRAAATEEVVIGHNPERILRLGLRDLDRILQEDPLEMGAAWSLATRLLWRGLELENCLLLLRKGTAGEFEAEYGFGSDAHDIRDNGLVQAKDKTIFSVSISQGRDVIIQRPEDPAIVPFVPPWLKGMAMGALIILPIADDGGTFAMLLGIAKKGQTFKLNPKTMEHLMTLRVNLGSMRKAKKKPAPKAG